MKLYQYLLFAAIVLAGCKPSGPSGTPQELIPRNRTIQPTNAYNDLFLDSLAVENYISHLHADDTTANHIRSFYNARNYEFAWFDSHGLTEQAAAFRTLYDYSKDTTSNKAVDIRMNALLDEDSITVKANDPATVKTELQLTQRLVQYAAEMNYSTKDLAHMVPMQKYDAMRLADSLLKADDKAHPGMATLKAPLQAYRDYVKAGGWPEVHLSAKSLRKGQSSSEIIQLKKRLSITGELKNNDSTDVFNDELEAAINTFRNGHGYTPNGLLTDTVLESMNMPAEARLQQLLINMERLRWMPAEPKGKLIMVNIPAFMLHVTDDGKALFDMDIIVGKEGHGTTMFSGRLNQIVFNPYWNIPRSIVRKEILPVMHRNPHYLASKNMEITGEANGLPVIRQRPGSKNALGRVKFLFPNSFHIYLHDTPEKSLFNRDNRAYSHGCIRLKEPMKMTQFLLQDSPQWTSEKVDSVINAGKEKFVRLKVPVPVIITYLTAWTDKRGNLHLVQDVYGHDAIMRSRMFY
ncbi:MAG TPA: L,D-transpeptidase family protein [Chitinophaga sp.]|uniref:L,D-transpeptidase family protein n=1 Tax=Chitinophaga sp. TaxID=1869181 RepID=UPI002B7D162B|nr:L,D-transpeptidase family protein [Chitinophaga sp.]HVI47663.1 L,D-transpeptidase family protein [Chitinophaga sp.]